MSFFSVVIALFKVNFFVISKLWIIKWFFHIKQHMHHVVLNYNDMMKADVKILVDMQQIYSAW